VAVGTADLTLLYLVKNDRHLPAPSLDHAELLFATHMVKVESVGIFLISTISAANGQSDGIKQPDAAVIPDEVSLAVAFLAHPMNPPSTYIALVIGCARQQTVAPRTRFLLKAE
jgi:hypothetical protein